jgi:hypothetical protein
MFLSVKLVSACNNHVGPCLDALTRRVIHATNAKSARVTVACVVAFSSDGVLVRGRQLCEQLVAEQSAVYSKHSSSVPVFILLLRLRLDTALSVP